MNDNLEENEIDNLFREGFQNYETTYQDSYWAEMEATLNKKKTRAWLWFAPALVLCSALASYWGISNYYSGASAETQNSSKYSNDINPLEPTENSVTVIPERYSVSSNKSSGSSVPSLSPTPKQAFESTFHPSFSNVNNNAGKTSGHVRIADTLVTTKNDDKGARKHIENELSDDLVKNDKDDLQTVAFDPHENNSVSETKQNEDSNTNTSGKQKTGSRYTIDFHLMGGATLANTFSNNTSDNKSRLNATFGFGFGFHFNEKLSINVDMAYQSRNGHDLTRSVQSDEYFLYKTSRTFTLHTTRTDYLIVPAYVKYNLGRTKRHGIIAGLYTNFLLNSYNTIETMKIDKSGISGETTKDKANYGAWETVNYGYIFGYEFMIYKNAGIGLSYGRGLKDATLNSFYSNSNTDKYRDLSLTLKYYFK